jgi:hypothetical protein
MTDYSGYLHDFISLNKSLFYFIRDLYHIKRPTIQNYVRTVTDVCEQTHERGVPRDLFAIISPYQVSEQLNSSVCHSAGNRFTECSDGSGSLEERMCRKCGQDGESSPLCQPEPCPTRCLEKCPFVPVSSPLSSPPRHRASTSLFT